jgi:hypothetical protein
MADTSRRIKVDALNFDEIKTNLKNFLKGQSQFKDYNFDGSGLSILLDTLAYNTHYNALYNNMAINEMFLDSASKRDSVVSIAKMLGYTPASSRAATATVNLTIKGVTTPDNLLVLPARFKFTTQVDGVSYTFMTTEEIVTEYTAATSSFVFRNVPIKEGTFQTEKYIVLS